LSYEDELKPSSLDPTDPFLRPEQTFPRLNAEMLARIGTYGIEQTIAQDVYLYRRGGRGIDFFVVLAGELNILDEQPGRDKRIVARIGAGQFAGEINYLSGRESLVCNQAAVATRVIRVPHAEFRRMMSAEPDIGEIITRAFILRRVAFLQHDLGGVVVVGVSHSAALHRLQRFLERNGYPSTVVATDLDPDAATILVRNSLKDADLPAVLVPGGFVLRNPSVHDLADEIGLTEQIDEATVFDVAVVGAGPAGLAAAVYGASEGLSTLVVEAFAPGGQAGTSSKIENYLGFPTGISGQALSGRGQVQAQKFGAHVLISRAVTSLDCSQRPFRLALDDGRSVQAQAIIVASGVSYRKLPVPDYDRFEGQGIYYAASGMEARLCEAQEVVIVGGGNSAGQAAMFLSRQVEHVHMLVRGTGLAETMSDYLVRRITLSQQITVHPFTEVIGLEGDGFLRAVMWRNNRTDAKERKVIGGLFVMIGAVPHTEWLDGCIPLDKNGFVETGADKKGQILASPYATQIPGIFAVGDVRSGSVKRVASAVGEGSVVIHDVHRFLHPAEA
jgi:thioredoxin reductase (NADPH)